MTPKQTIVRWLTAHSEKQRLAIRRYRSHGAAGSLKVLFFVRATIGVERDTAHLSTQIA